MKKNIVLLTCVLGLSWNAFARPDKEVLVCAEDSFHNLGMIRVELDSTGYAKSSGYTNPVSASIIYNYSGTKNMVCTGEIRFDSYNIKCAGYYWSDDLTELKISNVGNQILAEWTTSIHYGNQKMITPCVLKDFNN